MLKKFVGKNKPSWGKGLYICEAKLLYRIGTREGRWQTPRPQSPTNGGASSKNKKSTIQHKNHDASTPYRLVP